MSLKRSKITVNEKAGEIVASSYGDLHKSGSFKDLYRRYHSTYQAQMIGEYYVCWLLCRNHEKGYLS